MISRIKFDAGYQQGVAGHLERPGRGSDETNGGQLLASLLNFQIRIFGSIQQTTKGFKYKCDVLDVDQVTFR